MKTLVINRRQWRTGGDGEYKTNIGDTQLLNRDSKMCCLGFECLRRGFTKGQIRDIADPESLKDIRNDKYEKKLGDILDESGGNSKWVIEAIRVNDDEETTPLEKEILLKQLFSEQGIKIKFIN